MALHLAAKGDHRSLIALVEKWVEIGEPTPAARLVEARAFVELRQLDRAWVRLKDLVDTDAPDADALAVAAEMFVLRGWPNKARKAVQRGLAIAPEHPTLRTLAERATDGPTEPDEEGVESEQTPIAELIRVAEQHLAHGSFVRARTLLERVRKKLPDHRWAADLLWAMDGDFATALWDGGSIVGELTLADLCDRFGPDLALISDLPDEPEHTESASLADLPLQIERDDDARFPSLFRNLEPKTEAYAKAPSGAVFLGNGRETPSEPEVTAVRSLASVGTLAVGDPGDSTDPQADDTQIVRVVTRGDSGQADTGVDAAFNLADFRKEMGVDTPVIARDYTTGPEDEDDSVVVHTRRDESIDGRDATTDVGKGVLDDAADEQAAKERRGGVEDAGWAAPGSAPPPLQQRAAPARTPVPASRTRTRSVPPPPRRSVGPRGSHFAWPWWLAVLAAVLALGVLVFAVIALVAALQ